VGATEDSHPPLKKAATGSAASHLADFMEASILVSGWDFLEFWLTIQFYLVNQTEADGTERGVPSQSGGFP